MCFPQYRLWCHLHREGSQKILRNGLDNTWKDSYIETIIDQKQWKVEDRSVGATLLYVITDIKDKILSDKTAESLLKKINGKMATMNSNWPLVGISAGANGTAGQKIREKLELFDLNKLDHKAKAALFKKMGKFVKKPKPVQGITGYN